MAVSFDSSAYEAHSGAGTVTKAFTIPAIENRILIVAVGTTPGVTISAKTFAGIELAPLDSAASGAGGTDREILRYYLVNPPTGSASVVVTCDGSFTVAIACYVGVDVLNPWGAGNSNQGDPVTSISTVVTTQADWLVVDAAVFRAQFAPEPYPDVSQTERVDASATSTDYPVGMSEEQGSGSVAMSWTCDSNDAAIVAAPLLPARILRGRAVSYYYDVWDPQQRILDEFGASVAPWDVEPNRWIAVMGFSTPTSEVFDTFADDPRLAYIEEVSYEDSSGLLSIVTNRGELAEVIMAQAASGSNM